ncbi:hypothetical protein AAFF_G00440100 [Aldrovandia affinis]|uniref:RIIa domain-containing protein n=1 Tax=Aldrovandia affinis TaxID=143900 RepID=A0AAD7S9E1_9TELE|nr:hypothetical protein AAFF_G00440100 [Aldrovandia affinis]
MSIPFSNTNLRVPRGFGNILEGLAREVLRDQPQDIPTFAALYFSALLKDREESGLDPAEWGAKLEDRFYNNHAFKEREKEAERSSVSEQAAVGTVHENSVAETLGGGESESIQPVHISTVSTANLGVFDEVPGEESWGGGGGTGGEASEDSAELDLSHLDPYGGGTATAETLDCSENELIQPVHISTVSTANLGVFDEVLGVEESWGGGGTVGEDICSAELDPPFPDPYGGTANVDVCAEGLRVPGEGEEPP